MEENGKYPVGHVILMVIFVISALVGTAATTMWIRSLITERNCDLKPRNNGEIQIQSK